MSLIPASAITIADGEISLDTELLVHKLGRPTPITEVYSTLSRPLQLQSHILGDCHVIPSN